MYEVESVGATYARVSTAMQNEKSPDDQVRICRNRAAAEGIVIPDENVFIDRAISGTKPDRDALAALIAAAKARSFQVLFVEDLSRLFRESTHLMSMLKELVYEGIRIVSVNEGIDSSNESWHILATILGLQHEQFIRDLGTKVRRGQESAVLEGLSAGDLCLGFTSEPVPGTEKKRGRNRKPKMRLLKLAEAARWILQIFHWFAVEARSMQWIAKELTRLNVPKDHRSTTSGWHRAYVKGILKNEKYMGRWVWGRRRNRRNPTTGKLKQVPAPAANIIVRECPEMGLVPQWLWDLAQKRLQKLRETYPGPNGAAGRAGKSYVDLYPKLEFSGLLYCGSCGARFIASGCFGQYMACGGRYMHRCNVRTMVPRNRLRSLLLEKLRDLATRNTEWIDQLLPALHLAVRAADEDTELLPALESELRQVQQSLRNLAKAAEAADGCPRVIVQRIGELEDRQADLERQVRDLKARRDTPRMLPDRAWLADRLDRLNAWLVDEKQDLAGVFRAFTSGRIEMYQVIPPGKKRGYFTAKFKGGPNSVLTSSMCIEPNGDQLQAILRDGVATMESSEIVIDVLPPSRAEELADEVYRLRQMGHQWKDIRRRLRCGHAMVHEAHEIGRLRKEGENAGQ